jgi:hypothetical protein
MLLTFRPPRWPQAGGFVTALAQVVRVGLPRRRSDAGPAGMGLVFSDIDPDLSVQMADLMRGMPPPLPPIAIARKFDVRVEVDESVISLDDGSRFTLQAEGVLLTGGRSRTSATAHEPAALACRASRVLARGRKRKERSRRHHALRLAS